MGSPRDVGDLNGSGIGEEALWRFVDEQIYTLPGTDSHREVFTVLLTGSRATGMHRPHSDVDIDVLCPQAVYEAVHRASLSAGLIKSETSFFRTIADDDPDRYFGGDLGYPHFTITPLEEVQRQVREYEDVGLWIWTNARVIADPGRQFQRIVESFSGYPKDVLVRKIKYRWLLSAYWVIDVYPHHHSSDAEILAAATALVNSVNDLLRVFFLVEGRPFPYAEKLMPVAESTKLGEEFCPMLQHVANLVAGWSDAELGVWERLDRGFELLAMSDSSAECRTLDAACAQAMIEAGVEPQWVEADYDNIDELLTGKLGPVP